MLKISKSLYKATRQNGRVFGVRSGTVFALRSLRNFWYFWSNRKIWALSLCLEFFDAGDPGNFLHHLTTKKYLNGEFSLDQRIEYAFNHFLVDDQAFDASYKSAIYGGNGLVLPD